MCGLILSTVRLYNPLCFYTTGPFYASTMLLYATVGFVLYHCTFPRIYICTTHFAFTPLDDSTHLRCFCTPTGSFVLYHCTFRRIYVAHLAFTQLDDSTPLQCYCTPTVGFVLHHCTILHIYDATVRRLAVLFYTTVRFYASTFLRLTLGLHHCTILRRLSALFYTNCTTFYTSTFLQLTLHRNSVLNRNPG